MDKRIERMGSVAVVSVGLMAGHEPIFVQQQPVCAFAPKSCEFRAPGAKEEPYPEESLDDFVASQRSAEELPPGDRMISQPPERPEQIDRSFVSGFPAALLAEAAFQAMMADLREGFEAISSWESEGGSLIG